MGPTCLVEYKYNVYRRVPQHTLVQTNTFGLRHVRLMLAV